MSKQKHNFCEFCQKYLNYIQNTPAEIKLEKVGNLNHPNGQVTPTFQITCVIAFNCLFDIDEPIVFNYETCEKSIIKCLEGGSVFSGDLTVK